MTTGETEIEQFCRAAGPGDPEARGWLTAFKFLVATGGEPKEVSAYLCWLLRNNHLPPTPKQ